MYPQPTLDRPYLEPSSVFESLMPRFESASPTEGSITLEARRDSVLYVATTSEAKKLAKDSLHEIRGLEIRLLAKSLEGESSLPFYAPKGSVSSHIPCGRDHLRQCPRFPSSVSLQHVDSSHERQLQFGCMEQNTLPTRCHLESEALPMILHFKMFATVGPLQSFCSPTFSHSTPLYLTQDVDCCEQ